MTPTVLFVVGPPGAGKTTICRKILDLADPTGIERSLVLKPKWTVAPNLLMAGHYSGQPFDGADTVPYNGVRPALDWWAATTKPELTILDGDRFSNGPAKAWLEAQPIRLLCAHVAPPADTLAAWRAAREAAVGAAQNHAWRLGRETKASRFFDGFGSAGRRFDSTQPNVVHDLLSWAKKGGA